MKSLKFLILVWIWAGITVLSAKKMEIIHVPVSSSVSWKDMVNKQAINPDFGYFEKRAILFMRMEGFQYINPPSAEEAQKAFESNYIEQTSFEAKESKKFETSTSFLAIPDNNRAIPPDTMGAVGPTYVMTMLNTEVKIQDKTGGTVQGVISLATFWQSVATSTPFDSTLLFDKNSNRWIAVAEDFDKNILVAATVTNDPTGTWNFWKFNGASDDGKSWPDFPRVGINHKWIAVTMNMFADADNQWIGAKMWVIDKSTIGENKLSVKKFPDNFSDVGYGTGFTLVPAVTLDDQQDDLYIVDSGWTDGDNQYIRLSKLSGSINDPAWSVVGASDGYFQVPVNFTYQPEASQKGSSETIDAGDIRILNAVFINGKLWFTHGGGLPADTADRTAIFWYQVNATQASLIQSGTIDPGSGGYVFMPSIAVNKKDDVVIGFTRSNSNIYAQAVYASRSSNDPAGSIGPIVVSKVGEDAYTKDFGSSRIRWGDYSATVVDPADDTIFWTIQEYAAKSVGSSSSDDRWGTWWTKIDSNPANDSEMIIAPILYLLQ